MANSNYKDDRQGIVFNDRVFNKPVIYDFWDADRRRKNSRNFGIIAPTGGGKSYTWQHMSRQFYEQGISQVIIEIGESYAKLLKLYPAEDVAYFKYVEGEPLGLNPFGLQPGEIPTALKIDDVSEFVWTLIKKTEEPTENERTSLRQILNHFYLTEDEYNWLSFYNFIKDNKDNICQIAGIESNKQQEFFNVAEFLHAGSDFVEGGNYAFLFSNTEDNSSKFIGKKICLFELDQCSDNRLILSIMLQVISEATHKTIWADKTNPGIIFYDEFAKQLEFPEILQRVKYQTQAIRKYNGSTGIVLQSVNQLPESPEGKSILDNIETYIFLQGTDYKAAERRLNLSRHDLSQLNSLSSNFGGERPWSELYIKTSKGGGNVYRIETPREVFLAYQTEGHIHESILKLYKEMGNMEEAIKKYMNG